MSYYNLKNATNVLYNRIDDIVSLFLNAIVAILCVEYLKKTRFVFDTIGVDIERFYCSTRENP